MSDHEPRTPEAALAALDEAVMQQAICPGWRSNGHEHSGLVGCDHLYAHITAAGWSLVRTPTDGDLTAESEALLADLRERWPERGRRTMRNTVARALPAIEQAARRTALTASPSGALTAERLAKALRRCYEPGQAPVGDLRDVPAVFDRWDAAAARILAALQEPTEGRA